ncbi:MAG: tetratricopeptide repeat protein [Acidobacteriota bacterium]
MQKTKAAPQNRQDADQTPPGMVLKRNAGVFAVAMLLAGVFMGWQGAVVVFNQDALQGGKPGMQQSPQMPPGMPGGMPGQQGANPMTSPLMAQAKAMEEQAAKTPNDPAVWAKLGDTYFDAELPDRSVMAYQKSLALKPNQPNVWTDMGVMLRMMNKTDEALKAFEQAASLDPKHEQSRLNIGVVKYFDLKDTPGAIVAWKSLLAVNPDAKMPDGKRVADALKEISK